MLRTVQLICVFTDVIDAITLNMRTSETNPGAIIPHNQYSFSGVADSSVSAAMDRYSHTQGLRQLLPIECCQNSHPHCHFHSDILLGFKASPPQRRLHHRDPHPEFRTVHESPKTRAMTDADPDFGPSAETTRDL